MPLPEWELATNRVAVCTLCGAGNEVHVFPAALAQAAPAYPEAALEGEAACYDHPAKRAVAACRQCGRFVCQLCAVDFGGATWCPSCIAAGAGAAKAARLDASRTLYDSIALVTPLAALIVWPLTIIAGPAAVVFAVMKWKEPLSLVRRTRWRFAVGLAIGLAETGAWIWGIVYLVARARSGA
jgi:hypothetical protein